MKCSEGAEMFRNYFTARPTVTESSGILAKSVAGHEGPNHSETEGEKHGPTPSLACDVESGPGIFTGYLSDISEDEVLPEDEDDITIIDIGAENSPTHAYSSASTLTPQLNICMPPPLKRRRLEVPYRVSRQRA